MTTTVGFVNSSLDLLMLDSPVVPHFSLSCLEHQLPCLEICFLSAISLKIKQ